MGMLEPKKVKVGGIEYMIGRLDLFEAMNLSRICAPILPVLFHEVLSRVALAVLQSKKEEEATPEERIEEIGMLIHMSTPILQAIAKMPRDDFETVIRTGLSCIERRVGKSWQKVMQNGELIFDDIDQQTAFTLVVHVLARELRPTIAALGFSAGAAAQAKKGTSGNSPTASTT